MNNSTFATREACLRKNIAVVSFFSKLCYTPIFLVQIFPLIETPDSKFKHLYYTP